MWITSGRSIAFAANLFSYANLFLKYTFLIKTYFNVIEEENTYPLHNIEKKYFFFNILGINKKIFAKDSARKYYFLFHIAVFLGINNIRVLTSIFWNFLINILSKIHYIFCQCFDTFFNLKSLKPILKMKNLHIWDFLFISFISNNLFS